MTISLRSVRMLLGQKAPERKIERAAVETLKSHLENEAISIAVRASSIHDRENFLRAQLGERRKARLSARHVRMAIEGKFQGKGGDDT
ncbi:MAG: hypothetical protein AB1793_00235 [Candidatus Thermoplasmatota archaeon]